MFCTNNFDFAFLNDYVSIYLFFTINVRRFMWDIPYLYKLVFIDYLFKKQYEYLGIA